MKSEVSFFTIAILAPIEENSLGRTIWRQMPSVTEAVIQMCSLTCFQILASRISACPCLCSKKKKKSIFAEVPVVVRQSVDKWVPQRGVIFKEPFTKVSRHTLATLYFAEGVREICQIPLLLYFSGSGALPPVITKCLWDYSGPRASARGVKNKWHL